MKKAMAAVLCALACLCLFLLPAARAEGVEIGTQVSIIVDDFAITAQTEDFALPVGGGETLMFTATRTAVSCLWEVSADGGTSWTPAPGANTGAQYVITNAQQNSPATKPYIYRVTLKDDLGISASTCINVLVHDDYAYATRTDAASGITVLGFLHEQAIFSAKLIETESTASDLQGMIRAGYAPLAAYEARLSTPDGVTLPASIGRLTFTFTVDDAYDGETLNVYHKAPSGALETLAGTVDGDALPVTAETLHHFLIEVDAATVNAVTVETGAHGDVFPAGKVYVPKGGDKTFTFTPHAGYVLDQVLVDGRAVRVSGNSYTLRGILSDHTLRATFKKPVPSGKVYSVTILDPENGTVSPSGTQNVKSGASLTVYFYPDAGYRLSQVLVDGVSVSHGSNAYTFTVTKPVTITAVFSEKSESSSAVTRTVTATAGSHGSISPAGSITVLDGGDLYVYFYPDAGYVVESVTVDGVLVEAGTYWHFLNIRGERRIHVTFRASGAQAPTEAESGGVPGDQTGTGHATIHILGGENGTVSPSGTIAVDAGGSQTFYFYPDEGYEVDTFTVNGVAADGSSGSYTLENMQGETKICVSFRPVSTGIKVCTCAICGLWRGIFPGLRCICPWCWLVPALIIAAAACVIIAGARRKKRKDR